jgi:hypothetical protein
MKFHWQAVMTLFEPKREHKAHTATGNKKTIRKVIWKEKIVCSKSSSLLTVETILTFR